MDARVAATTCRVGDPRHHVVHLSMHCRLQVVLRRLPLPHVAPRHPRTPVHAYDATRSLHVPPFAHGRLAHSSTSVLHRPPAYPAVQLHEYVSTRGWLHVAPCAQGFDAHSSMSVQLRPLSRVAYPG